MDMMNYGQPMYGMGGAIYHQPGYYNYGLPTPNHHPSLTAEEMKLIATQNPNKLDITITEADKYRAICNHKDQNKIDRVVQLSDGSGDVFCPICNYRWNPENLSKEEVKDLCDKLIAAMQNAKWVGDYGVELTRQYFAMIPLLEKFPDLYEYAMKQFNRYCSTNGYASANDAAIYNQYNSLMGFSSGYGYNPQPQGYYGSTVNPQYAQAPQYGMPMNPYMNQGVVQQPATNVNPMQAQGMPNPYAAQGAGQTQGIPNPYAAQGAMQPTPGVGAPINGMAAPSYAPAAAQQPAGATPTVTENANGTTTSESTVKLS